MTDRLVNIHSGPYATDLWFAAGEAVAHHIENTSDAPLKFLVFGERKRDDVVFYPNR